MNSATGPSACQSPPTPSDSSDTMTKSLEKDKNKTNLDSKEVFYGSIRSLPTYEEVKMEVSCLPAYAKTAMHIPVAKKDEPIYENELFYNAKLHNVVVIQPQPYIEPQISVVSRPGTPSPGNVQEYADNFNSIPHGTDHQMNTKYDFIDAFMFCSILGIIGVILLKLTTGFHNVHIRFGAICGFSLSLIIWQLFLIEMGVLEHVKVWILWMVTAMCAFSCLKNFIMYIQTRH